MTIAPNPKTNPKPNPNTNRGGSISLGDNSLVAPYNPKTNPDLDPNPTPNPGAISLGGKLSGCRNIVNIFEKSTLKYYLGPLLQIIKSLD